MERPLKRPPTNESAPGSCSDTPSSAHEAPARDTADDGEAPQQTPHPSEASHDTDLTIRAAGHLESRAAQDRALTGDDGPHRQWVAQTLDDPADAAVPLADIPAAVQSFDEDGEASSQRSDDGDDEDANSQMRTFFANDGA